MMIYKKILNLRNYDSFWMILAAFIITGIFLPAIGNQIALMDDLFYLMHARRPLDWQTLFAPVLDLRTPLVTLSFRIDLLLFGERYFFTAAHIENILLHTGSALVLYQLLRILHWKNSAGQELTLTPFWCAITALIFACHPQRVESVAWIAERKDVLAMFFGLTAFFFFYRSLKKQQTSFAAPLLLLLSFAAKPMWIFFVVPAALLIWVEQRNFRFKMMLKLLLPVLLATGVYILLQLPLFLSVLQNGISEPSRPLWQKTELILYNYGLYFLKTFIPGKLFPIYPYYNPDFSCRWIALIPLLLLAVPLFGLKKELRQGVFFGWVPALAAFAIVAIPTVGFTQVGNTDFADRYSYLPSLMLWIPAAFQLQVQQPRSILKLLRPILAVLYLEFLAGATFHYLPAWRTPVTFARAVLDSPHPNSDSVLYDSSVHLMKKNFRESAALLRRKLKISRYDTESVKEMIVLYTWVHKGTILFMNGKPEQGIKYYRAYYNSRAWRLLSPCSVNLLEKIFTEGADYYQNKRNDKKRAAILCFRCAEILKPRAVHYYHFYCGKANLYEEDYPRAVSEFEKALAAAPNESRYKEALENCKKLLQAREKKL